MSNPERSAEFIRGFERAELDYLRHESDDSFRFANPFPNGSEEANGYDEGTYIFTQK